ncbi:hypothetical protein AX774_g3269 [Zancudomyces culisetae]|uniref:Uncharacterized protein n=1 Tax=Zancudomyces culisetae TaxID=1213189 RepID=A0A1R1PQJ5_ZANCU|nr:hypothetical protein AX774_g3269 [Zancudomyces culisetae]|eukprot:OMH83228.1 hypothetical protein AX774_g3269 [Zancudomyces culisetae]
MFKPTILSILVLGSALAYSIENTQNQYNLASDENGFPKAKFNNMHCECSHEHIPRMLKLEPSNSSNFDYPKDTLYAIPNKCYNGPGFRSVRMDGINEKRGFMKYCSDYFCAGKCIDEKVGKAGRVINLFKELQGRPAVSYVWIAPFH